MSNAAVSYALNGRPGVSEEIRNRIVAIARDLHYRPNRLATGLRRGRTHVLGLLLADLSNPYYSDMAAGVIEQAAERGYQVFVAGSGLGGEMFASELAALRDHRCDGLIFTALVEKHRELLVETMRAGVPCVQLTRRLEGVEADFVGIDDHAAGLDVALLVARSGYRHPAIINGPAASSASRGRLSGYRDGLAAAGIAPMDYANEEGPISRRSGFERAAQLLSGAEPRPDVLICGDDNLALGALEAAHTLGAVVPDDIAVVGYSGLDFAASPLVELATVNAPRVEMGAAAARTVIARIEDPDRPLQNIVLPHSLVVRRSCPPRAAPALPQMQ